MIDIKQAAKIAVNYIADLLGSENVEEPRIEEVRLSSKGNKWLITVGFFPKRRIHELHNPLLGRPNNEREYKQVQITDDGTVTAMKMRKP